jgi:hypothetical protein
MRTNSELMPQRRSLFVGDVPLLERVFPVIQS